MVDVIATRTVAGIEHRVYLVPDMDAPDPRVDWDCDDETTIQQWYDGEVYGYVVERHCPCCSGWEHVDSCYGLYGYEYATSEAKDVLAGL